MRLSDTLAIATINATVLAIFFAVVSGYAFLSIQTLSALTTELISAASEINGVSPVLVSSDSLKDAIDPQDWTARDALTAEAAAVIAGDHRDGDTMTVRERVRRLIQILSYTTVVYPFKTRMRMMRGGGVAVGERELSFARVNAVEIWVGDMYRAIGRLLPTLELRADEIDHLLKDWWSGEPDEEEIGQARAMGSLLAQSGAGSRAEMEAATALSLNARSRVDEALELIRRGYRIAEDVSTKLEELRRLKRRLPKSTHTFAALLLAGGAFGAGVLVPILVHHPPLIVYGWIPLVIYSLGFVALLISVGRAYDIRRGRRRTFR